MNKIIQNSAGFQIVDSTINPEYFSLEELALALGENNIKTVYNQDISDLETIQNTPNPTNAQVIWAVKKEAEIIERLAKFIKNNIIR